MKNSRNSFLKNLFSRSIISTFNPQKKSTLKTGPQINISELVFAKPSESVVGFGLCRKYKGTGKNEKKCNSFGVLH